MSSDGPLFAGSASNNTGVGSLDWANLTNVTAADGAYVTNGGGTSSVTHYLLTAGHSFSIPVGSLVIGIVAEVRIKSQFGVSKDTSVKLAKGGVIGGNNNAFALPFATTDTWITYGANNDLWGQTWSPSDINASNFGLAFSATVTGTTDSLFLDAVRITVYYTTVVNQKRKLRKKMGYFLKQSSTEQILVFQMISSTDHVSAVTGLTPTVTLSKAGAAFASPAGAVSEIANGWYKVAGNATDTGTLGPLILHATGTGADPWDDVFEVVAFDPQDATKLGLSALTMPTNFSSLSITGGGDISVGKILGTAVTESIAGQLAGGFTKFHDITSPTGTQERIPHVTLADTITTYTGNTPQTGDNYARIGVNGVNLTNIGDTRMAFLDASVSSRLASASYTAPLTSSAVATAVLDATASSHNTAGTIGAKINSAASAGDPWTTSLPGSYTAGEAGYIIGTYIDAAISSRSTYAGGAVASVTGNVGGNVVGSVGSVTGAVGSVTGNVGGNVSGSVASVVADVGITQTGADKVWSSVTRALTDKLGFKLASDGLDSVSTTAPTGVAANLREMIVQLWRRPFKKSTLTSTQLKTYADDGVTVVTTQTVSDDGTTQTQGAAS